MKNNIRYKGNTNNTSVIIFLKVKNSQRWYFAWENLRGGFCDVVSSFYFCIFILLLYLDFICRCSSFTFAFRHHPLPFRGLSPVFTLILYFQPSPSQGDLRYFHFQLFRDLLTASATVLSGRFLPTGFFYLTLLHRHF